MNANLKYGMITLIIVLLAVVAGLTYKVFNPKTSTADAGAQPVAAAVITPATVVPQAVTIKFATIDNNGAPIVEWYEGEIFDVEESPAGYVTTYDVTRFIAIDGSADAPKVADLMKNGVITKGRYMLRFTTGTGGNTRIVEMDAIADGGTPWLTTEMGSLTKR